LPIVDYLKVVAANARQLAIDDTGNRILDQTGKQLPDRRTGKPRHRTGIYSSALMAWTETQQTLVLFNTNIGHAGEWLDEIIQHRPGGLPPPLVMSDALNRNQPSVIDDWHRCLCNSHARREFDACGDDSPEARWVIDQYEQIWQNDTLSQEQGMDATARLQWHKAQSLPVMQGILDKCRHWLDSQEVEANSTLGRACQYFINHFPPLSG